MRNDQLCVYLVDDSHLNLKVIKAKLRAQLGLKVRTFDSAEECLRMMERRAPDMVIADYQLDPYFTKRMNGDALLERIKYSYPDLPVIMYSASKNVNLIVDMMKMGALDFVNRNQEFEPHLMSVVSNTLEKLKAQGDEKLIKRGIWISLALLLIGSVAVYISSPGIFAYLVIGLLVTIFALFALSFLKVFNFSNRKWLKYLGQAFTIEVKKKFSIFIVDDSELYRMMLTKALDNEPDFVNKRNYSIRVFPSAEKCLEEINSHPDILILDYLLEGTSKENGTMNGMEMLHKVKEISPATEVVMISGQKDLDVITDLIKQGAKDYVEKDMMWQKKIKNVVRKIASEKASKRSKVFGWLFFIAVAGLIIYLLFMYSLRTS